MFRAEITKRCVSALAGCLVVCAGANTALAAVYWDGGGATNGLTLLQYAGAATLQGTLTPGFRSGSSPANGTWDLLSADLGITATGFAMASGVDPKWSYAIVAGAGGGSQQTLQISYFDPALVPVPEPGTLTLLATGLLGLLGCAWRKRGKSTLYWHDDVAAASGSLAALFATSRPAYVGIGRCESTRLA